MSNKSNHSKYVGEHRRKCKRMLVCIFGGKCKVCGYNKCVRSLHLHHVDPNNKKFAISTWSKLGIFDLLEEAKSCVLVCSNCHGEIESGVTVSPPCDLEIINTLTLAQKNHLEQKQSKVYFKKCLTCYKYFSGWSRKDKYCSAKCCAELKRKVIRPSKEELFEMLWKKPTTKIAEEFGVSDKAITKWAKAYQIKKPPRGYWTKRN